MKCDTSVGSTDELFGGGIVEEIGVDENLHVFPPYETMRPGNASLGVELVETVCPRKEPSGKRVVRRDRVARIMFTVAWLWKVEAGKIQKTKRLLRMACLNTLPPISRSHQNAQTRVTSLAEHRSTPETSYLALNLQLLPSKEILA